MDSRIQAEQRCHPASFRGIGADLAGKVKQHSETFIVAAVVQEHLTANGGRRHFSGAFLVLFSLGIQPEQSCVSVHSTCLAAAVLAIAVVTTPRVIDLRRTPRSWWSTVNVGSY